MTAIPKLLLLSCCVNFFSFCATAQNATGTDNSPKPKEKPAYLRNVVKMNLSSLAMNNYNFTYERLIGQKTSVLASYRHMPQTTLSTMKLTDKIACIADNEDIKNDLDVIDASNKTFTAEVRFYGGRKPGAKGIYFGLYGRHAGFTTDYLYAFSPASTNKDYNIPLKAKYNGMGAGFLMGAQFALAKRIMVDLYLLGGHYGKTKGDVQADIDLSALTPADRQDLQNELNDLLMVGDKSFMTTTVSNKGVTGTISGPFAGLRGLGLNVGFAF